MIQKDRMRLILKARRMYSLTVSCAIRQVHETDGRATSVQHERKRSERSVLRMTVSKNVFCSTRVLKTDRSAILTVEDIGIRCVA